jgi:acyl-coenzyme A synthetase/AMP-(fatty) acid ligase
MQKSNCCFEHLEMYWRASDIVDALALEQRAGLLFIDEHGHRRDYTFAEVTTHSQRYAAVLRAFGVCEGDRVHVALSATAKCIFTLLALQRLGAEAILDYVEAAGATAIISNRKNRSRVDETREHFAPDACYIIIGEECEGWARLDTLARVASPIAGVDLLANENELADARAAAFEHLGAFATDRVWCALQIEDKDWFDRAIVQPWLLGAAPVAHTGAFDARERLDLVRELDVTILLQRADEYHAELALPEPKRFKMARLRRCIVLEGECDDVLQRQWEERFGVPLTPTPSAKV